MRKYNLATAIVFFYCLSASFAQNTKDLNRDHKNQKNSVQTFAWLTGKWQTPIKNGNLFEKWEAMDNGSLQSIAYTEKNTGETAMMESVKIEYENDSYTYTSTVPDQNNQLPVQFRITSFTKTGFVAENPEHDFPQRISYQLKDDTTLYAFIDGKLNGKYVKNEFTYRRVEDSNDRTELIIRSKNMALVKTFFDHFNKHEWEKMAGLYSDPAVFLDPSFGQQVVKQTRLQTAKKYKELEGVFKDIRDDIIRIYPSGDKNVIVWFVSSGTASNGKKFTLPICTILTIENGQITTDLTFYDNSSQK